jgi:hypothetical protein
LGMSKEAKAVTGLVTALIGLAITISGHWFVGNVLSLSGVIFTIVSLAKAKD